MTYFYGTKGRDTIHGGPEGDNIFGLSGNDILSGGFGSDVIAGGSGRDRVYGGFQGDYLYGDDGDDRVMGDSGDDTISGGQGADQLVGGLGEDSFYEAFLGFWSGDRIDGGLGLDLITLDLTGLTARLSFAVADPTDTVTVFGASVTGVERYTIHGTDYDDTFTGGHWTDLLQGNGGNDTLYGRGGTDYIDGGTGNDFLSGRGGNDTIHGGHGNDALYGDAGHDTLAAGLGNDKVLAGNGDDEIEMRIGQGKDTVDGGAGLDRLTLSGLTAGFTAKAADVVNTLSDGSTVTGIEAYVLEGSSGSNAFTTLGGDDKLFGFDGNDVLKAGAGDDLLYGGWGDDTLWGEAGDDLLDPGGGKDTLYGGAGTDTAVIDLSSLGKTDISFSLSSNTATLSNGTTAKDVEIFHVTTAAGNDTLKAGSALRVSFDGGDGNDTLYGGAGDDLLDGGRGYDTLSFAHFIGDGSVKLDLAKPIENDGLAKGLTVKSIEQVNGTVNDDDITGRGAAEKLLGGGDILNGRGGNDTLNGGTGADLLTGGAGRDTFVFDDFTSGGDVITDFTRGEDHIAIVGAEFGLADDYALLQEQGVDPQPAGTGPVFLYETDSHRLWFDADGSGGESEARLVVTLNGVSSLAAEDFMFL